MKSKKILSLLLTGAILAGMVPGALAVGEEPSESVPAVTEETTGGGETKVEAAKVGDTTYETLQGAIDAAKSDDTVILLTGVTEDITIAKDDKITLDLNGKTITNKAEDTITVALGGELTITGVGTVDNITHGKAALYNNGTTILNGGTYTRSKENGQSSADNGGNSFYNILNHGNLTINKDVEVSQSGHYSSMIENGYQSYKDKSARKGYVKDTNAEHPETTINGGSFSGGLNTVKNDDGGIMTINGGKFKNQSQATFLNWNVATINDGTFDATQGKDGAVLNGYTGELDQGNLTVNGGTFTGKAAFIRMADTTHMGKIEVTGGTFNVTNTIVGLNNFENIGTGATITFTGGTFSKNPKDYVPDTHHVKAGDSAFIVEPGAPAFGASIDTRGNANLSATAFSAVPDEENTYEATITGKVDMRTYLVTDQILQKDFAGLLANTREAVASAAEGSTIPNKYVKHGLNLVFADIDFRTPDGEKLGTASEYTIKQVNPGMAYAYPQDEGLKGGIKESTKTVSEELSNDGMTFILADSDKTSPITNPAVDKGDVLIRISYKDKPVTTFIIHNEVVFTESDAPAAAAPVVEVVPEVSTDKTATATVESSAADKVTAAAGTADKTLTIDAGNVGTAEVDKTELTLDSAVVKALAEATTVTTEIVTPVGTVTLPAKAAAQIKAGATSDGTTSDVVLTVEAVTSKPDETDAAYKVEIKKSGETDALSITGLTEAIKLSFDVGAGRDDNPTLVYVDTKSGNALKPIANSHYDANTGILTGSTLHLSTFAVRKAVYGTTADATAGIGKKVTLTAAKGNYLTVQVTNNGANAIYTVQVPDGGAVEIYVPTGSVLSVWETTGVPTFANGVMAPNGYIGSWVNQTIN